MNGKRLAKVEQGKMICGVCAGLADYFDIDPTIVRIGWLILTFAGWGSPIFLYFIAAVIMPTRIDPEN